MSRRRSTSDQITDSDAFCGMDIVTQCLYFHLNQRADDEGFFRNYSGVIGRLSGGDRKTYSMLERSFKKLLAKKFVLQTHDAYVIKGWWINNTKHQERITFTTCDKTGLFLDENKSYTFNNPNKPLIDESIKNDLRPESAQVAPKVGDNLADNSTSFHSISSDSITPDPTSLPKEENKAHGPDDERVSYIVNLEKQIKPSGILPLTDEDVRLAEKLKMKNPKTNTEKAFIKVVGLYPGDIAAYQRKLSNSQGN